MGRAGKSYLPSAVVNYDSRSSCSFLLPWWLLLSAGQQYEMKNNSVAITHALLYPSSVYKKTVTITESKTYVISEFEWRFTSWIQQYIYTEMQKNKVPSKFP